jgi:hypothetical protein
VNSCADPRRPDEAGFLLVEALVAVALVAICGGAALAAVVAVMHATARSLPAPALSGTVQNILTDLRAATAYDPAQLAALAGRGTTFDADEPGPDGEPRRVHITASVIHEAATDTYVGSVTARASNGTRVTFAARLVQEAPAPGAVIPAGTPPPSDPSRSAQSAPPAACDPESTACAASGGISL